RSIQGVEIDRQFRCQALSPVRLAEPNRPILTLPLSLLPSTVMSYLSVIGMGLLTFISHLSLLPATVPSKLWEPWSLSRTPLSTAPSVLKCPMIFCGPTGVASTMFQDPSMPADCVEGACAPGICTPGGAATACVVAGAASAL